MNFRIRPDQTIFQGVYEQHFQFQINNKQTCINLHRKYGEFLKKKYENPPTCASLAQSAPSGLDIAI